MVEKNLNSRIVHKHDTEENWLKATNFYPKQGELIVYDVDDNYDYERFKIGDGTTLVSELPFALTASQSDWNQEDESAADYIKNKPDLTTKADLEDLENLNDSVLQIDGKISGDLKNHTSFLARTSVANTKYIKLGKFTGDNGGGRAIFTINGKAGWNYKNDGGLKVLTLSSNIPSDANGICTGATFYDFGRSDDNGTTVNDDAQNTQILLVRATDYSTKEVDVYIQFNTHQYNSFFVTVDYSEGCIWETDIQTITTSDTDPTTNAMASLVVPKKIIADATKVNSALDTKVDREVAIVGSNEANSAGWYKVADGTMSAYSNISMIFVVHNTLYNAHHSGILQLDLRADGATENIKCQLGWLVRNGFDADQVIVVTDGLNWAMYCKVKSNQYYRIFFEVIQKSSIWKISASNYNLYMDSTVETTTPAATYTSSDLGVIKTINENLDKKVNLTNGTISGAVDWNTITTTGCYKIQACTMHADYNAPVNEYGYGILQVLNTEGDTKEHRVVQIYMPHKNIAQYHMYIRSNNSWTGYDAWTDWVGFYNANQINDKLATKADVETGTCTFTAHQNTGSTQGAATISDAVYHKVGNLVTVRFKLTPLCAGELSINGLPFASVKISSGYASNDATFETRAMSTGFYITSESGSMAWCTMSYLTI